MVLLRSLPTSMGVKDALIAFNMRLVWLLLVCVCMYSALRAVRSFFAVPAVRSLMLIDMLLDKVIKVYIMLKLYMHVTPLVVRLLLPFIEIDQIYLLVK